MPYLLYYLSRFTFILVAISWNGGAQERCLAELPKVPALQPWFSLQYQTYMPRTVLTLGEVASLVLQPSVEAQTPAVKYV